MYATEKVPTEGREAACISAASFNFVLFKRGLYDKWDEAGREKGVMSPLHSNRATERLCEESRGAEKTQKEDING